MTYVEYLPSVKNLSIQSITDAVQTSIVTVKNEIETIEEPRDLRPDVPGFEGDYFSVKQQEVEQWLTVLTNTLTSLKKQRDIHSQTSASTSRIGEIMQKIHNLDHTKINLKH